MPNRILKESICTSDNLDLLSPFQETFFYRLIVNCDDYGRLDARPKILAAKLFPLKSVRLDTVTEALQALASAELVILYEVDGKPFLQMKSWERHQQIRAMKSRYPAPACNGQQMIATDDPCPRNPIQKETESESIRDRAQRFTPPTGEDVRLYCQEAGIAVDAQRFCDFYASKGWKVGSAAMKDWKAAVRTWAQREKDGDRGAAGKVVGHQQYAQRAYENSLNAADEMMKQFMQNGGAQEGSDCCVRTG